MSSSYRIRTELGIDKVVQVKLEQNFDTLELLSLYINPNDVYTRACADYGVVVGRVFCNKGLGLPNAKVSIFIALDDADINDVVISTLYPYKTYNDVNEDGYKYNLLPYVPSYTGHIPVGTFPDRSDVLKDKSVIEVYDKYFKFVVSTNGSGDFMILGVPPGQHTLFMQVDLSDIGEFSFTPADLIRIGRGTDSQFNGSQFKFSENYSELPQIVTISKTIQVAPFYGEQESCNYYISRNDFDLTAEAQITISPTAVFMGSLVSANDETKVGYNNIFNKCKIPKTMGDLCDLVTGPGQILALRQSYLTDSDGLPIIEKVELENGGKVIDDNGTWLLEVPMNLEYVYTDEQGNRQVSNNPEIGIPTKGKYRFKVKWEQGPELSESTKRAYFLVPNVKEYGWGDSGDPYLGYNFNESIGISVSIDIPSASPDDNGEYIYLSTYLQPNSNFVYRLSSTLNVEEFQIFYSDGTQFTSQNIYSEDIPLLYLVYDRIDTGTDAIINFLKIEKDRFLLEQSYAFSLDWSDYANIQEAINCEDTFMELQYNKVYTVSQLVDRFVADKRPWTTTGIKNILDEKCTGTYNKFPTNDAFFRVNFTYIIYNLIFEVFRYVTIILLIVAHILGFLWLIIGPVLAGIVTIIQNIVRGLCVALNWFRRRFGKAERPCPTPIDVTAFFTGNPFKNIGLPLLLYTEDGCDRCQCRLDDQSVNFDSIGQPNLFTLLNSSLLIDSTDFTLYRSDNIESEYISGLFAGDANPNNDFQYNRFPIVTAEIEVEVEVNNNGDTDIKTISNTHFSTSLPYSEYLNSWNNKGRFFSGTDEETDFGNQNSFFGSTRMIVSIEPDLNNPMTKYHFDNFTVILIDPSANPLQAGKIVSFQDRNLSNDLNFYSEERGTFATGTTINSSHINVQFTNPVTAGQMSTTYNLPGYDNRPNTTGFPSDIEYFQVITGWTIGEYKQIVGLSLGGLFNGFWLYNMEHYEYSTGNNVAGYNGRIRRFENPTNTDNITDLISDIDDYRIIVLMRGVDVHSPRVKQRIYMDPFFYSYPDGFGYVNNNGTLPSLNSGVLVDPNFYIEGDYKLNIPLQPNSYNIKTCTRHNQLGTNVDADQWGSTVFYDSYSFNYNTNLFSAYTTNMLNYYSSFDITTFGPNIQEIPSQFANSSYNPLYLDFALGYTRNSPINFMGGSFSRPQQNPGSGQGNCTLPKPTTPVYTLNKWRPSQIFGNFIPYQNLEGQSLYFLNIGYNYYNSDCESCGGTFAENIQEPCSLKVTSTFNRGFISPSYNSTNSFANSNANGYTIYSNINIVNSSRIVVRTDRLPTSTSESINEGNSYLMHQNPTFAIFQYDDSGEQSQLSNVTQQAFSINDSTSQFLPYAEIAESLSDCEKAVTLECYDLVDGVPTIRPDCRELMNPTSSSEKFFNYGTGCYNLVSKLILTIPKDIKSVVEWSQRTKINNAVCFNVFSHSFSNQWINGTLYAYPFNNKRVFNIQNQPFSVFCKETIYFHETSNTFYYRSSPYSTTEGFVGKNNTTFGDTINYGNFKFLQSPTTMLDLGPKSYFIQELVNNDDYDGYIVSKVKSTSYNNVSEILNLFILSRLINPNFLQFLIPSTPGVNEGSDDPTVRGFFKNRRWENNNSSSIPAMVDADYAQMISINSEFGISPFSVPNYAQAASSPYQPVILGDENQFPFFGLLLTGNTQNRDYITPRRTIWNPQATIDTPQQYNFTEIPVKTQEVPFYLWKLIKMNNADTDQPMDYGTIFGSQNNNWVTDYPDSSGEFNSAFFTHRYQKLDRLDVASRYFQVDGNIAANYRSTLINFDTNGVPIDTIPTQNYNPQFLVGAPNHFYFGLKRGSSAMDRFLIKYVNTEEVIE